MNMIEFLKKSNLIVCLVQLVSILITTILINTNNKNFPEVIILTNPAMDHSGAHYFNYNLTVFAGIIPLGICCLLLSYKRYKEAVAVAVFSLLFVIPLTISAVTFTYDSQCFILSVWNVVNFSILPAIVVIMVILIVYTGEIGWLGLGVLFSVLHFVIGSCIYLIYLENKFDMFECNYISAIYAAVLYISCAITAIPVLLLCCVAMKGK